MSWTPPVVDAHIKTYETYLAPEAAGSGVALAGKHAKKMLRDFGPGDLWRPFQHAAAADVDSIYTAAAAARPVLGHAII